MINHVSIQGRFTKDLELKHTQNGVAVCNFTLAWNERYGDKEQTLFLNCVAYRNTAEFVEKYFRKGDQTIVEGKLVTRSYDDSQGQKKYVTELIVDKIHFCGSKKDKEESQEEYIDVSDDLPF